MTHERSDTVKNGSILHLIVEQIMVCPTVQFKENRDKHINQLKNTNSYILVQCFHKPA